MLQILELLWDLSLLCSFHMSSPTPQVSSLYLFAGTSHKGREGRRAGEVETTLTWWLRGIFFISQADQPGVHRERARLCSYDVPVVLSQHQAVPGVLFGAGLGRLAHGWLVSLGGKLQSWDRRVNGWSMSRHGRDWECLWKKENAVKKASKP